MKQILFLIVLLFLSCKEETKESFGKYKNEDSTLVLGKELFNGKGMCYSCHHPSQKIVGPSIKEISEIYKQQNASIVSFLKEESKPIVDASHYEIMKTNFVITKAMSDDELKAIESYIFRY